MRHSSPHADRPLPPTEEGSAAACRLLLCLHRHPDGLSVASLSSLTGLDLYTVRDALGGLAQRCRAANVRRGGLIIWHTMHNHTQARRACA
jgi:hypothetical protein